MKKNMGKKTKEFARAYLDLKLNLPAVDLGEQKVAFYYCRLINEYAKRIINKDLLENKLSVLDKHKLTAISHIRLKRASEVQLYRALFELMTAHLLAGSLFKRINLNLSKQRRSCITHLEKSLKYEKLSLKCRSVIQLEIERLLELDKKKVVYNPFQEVEHFDLLFNVLRWESSILQQKISILKYGTSALPPLDAFYREAMEKLSVMEDQPVRFTGTKPSQFFFKTLKIVIFMLLHEDNNIPTEKAKNLTAEIINEYLDRDPHNILRLNTKRKFKTLTNRDIDNAFRDR